METQGLNYKRLNRIKLLRFIPFLGDQFKLYYMPIVNSRDYYRFLLEDYYPRLVSCCFYCGLSTVGEVVFSCVFPKLQTGPSTVFFKLICTANLTLHLTLSANTLYFISHSLLTPSTLCHTHC